MNLTMLAQAGALGVGAVWGWLLGMLLHRPGAGVIKLFFGGGGSLLVGALTGWIAGPGSVVWFVAGALLALSAYWLWRRHLRRRASRRPSEG